MSGKSHRSGVEDPLLDDWFSEQEGDDWFSEQDEGRESVHLAWHAAHGRSEPEGDPLSSSETRPAAAVVRRRRAAGLSVLFVLFAVAIAIPLAVLGGGGEEAAESPPTAPVTEQPQPATTVVEQPTETAATPETPEPASKPLTVELPESGALSLGDRGEAVEQLQRALAALEFDPGEPDGILGGNTRTAVVKFQEANGLEPDGIVGENTVRELNAALAERGVTE